MINATLQTGSLLNALNVHIMRKHTCVALGLSILLLLPNKENNEFVQKVRPTGKLQGMCLKG